MKKKILFICTGNTCRSTMAEAIALKLISEKKERYGDIIIASAGLQTQNGLQASSHALKVTNAEGIDLTGFRSQVLTNDLLKEADIVLTMTFAHKQKVIQLAPEKKEKIFVLKEFIRDFSEISANYASADELYQSMQIKQINFLQKYKKEIERLEAKRQKLQEELEEVAIELGGWHERLYMETFEERKELDRLEKKLENVDISDPYGQPIAVYEKCYQELYEAINKALEKIIEK